MVGKSRASHTAVVDQDRRISRSPTDHDSIASSSDNGSQDDKDETEIELEKLVFGDDTGFRENLRPPKAESYEEEIRRESGDDPRTDVDLTALADGDVRGNVVCACPCAHQALSCSSWTLRL